MPQVPSTNNLQADSFYHTPVMIDEVLASLAPKSGELFVDGTMGGGGHSQGILRAGAKIIGLDRDGGAIGYCIQHLVVYDGDTVRVKQANFRELTAVLSALKISKVDGILLDIGISSAQIDRADRGFSFQRSGPLDMRMDRSRGVSAEQLVNETDGEELERIIRAYGEEPQARRIAAAIVTARKRAPFTETLELARAIEQVVPRHGPKHPATKTFQALRMAVNDELGALEDGLRASVDCLKPGGRLGIITFHSLEDRIVKNFARETTAPLLDRPEWPAPRPNPGHAFRAVTRKAIQPSVEEQRRNPRSRSAKLRVMEKLRTQPN